MASLVRGWALAGWSPAWRGLAAVSMAELRLPSDGPPMAVCWGGGVIHRMCVCVCGGGGGGG